MNLKIHKSTRIFSTSWTLFRASFRDSQEKAVMVCGWGFHSFCCFTTFLSDITQPAPSGNEWIVHLQPCLQHSFLSISFPHLESENRASGTSHLLNGISPWLVNGTVTSALVLNVPVFTAMQKSRQRVIGLLYFPILYITFQTLKSRR